MGTIYSLVILRFQELVISIGEHLKGGTIIVKIGSRYYRPVENGATHRQFDQIYGKIRLETRERSRHAMLTKDMDKADFHLFQKDQLLLKEGFGKLNYSRNQVI